jgi:hypothetical protein
MHLRNSREKTERRLNVKSEHKDFLWYILKQREKKNEVSDDEVIMNAALFMYVHIINIVDMVLLLIVNPSVLQEAKRQQPFFAELPINLSETRKFSRNSRPRSGTTSRRQMISP